VPDQGVQHFRIVRDVLCLTPMRSCRTGFHRSFRGCTALNHIGFALCAILLEVWWNFPHENFSACLKVEAGRRVCPPQDGFALGKCFEPLFLAQPDARIVGLGAFQTDGGWALVLMFLEDTYENSGLSVCGVNPHGSTNPEICRTTYPDTK